MNDKIRVIRCKDCTWYEGDRTWYDGSPADGKCTRHIAYTDTTPEGFCHLAEMTDGTRVSDINEEGLEWTE